MSNKFNSGSRLILDSELPGFCLEQHFSLGSILLGEGKKNTIATCDLFIRKSEHRNFLLAGGLEAVINFIENLKYDDELISYLLKIGRITEDFADYLKNFKFSGNIDAMPEGTVCFFEEPVLRITAPIIETHLITDILISLVNIDTMILSKLARVRIAAKDRQCSIGSVRAQGIDSGWRISRNTTFFNKMGFSNVTSSFRMGLGAMASTVNANHAFIKSFDNEMDALRAATKYFPNVMQPMVDTYDIKQGIENLIKVADELKEKNEKILGIMIDSGDLLELTKYARKRLDESGHPEIKISVASNLNEYRVAKLLEAEIPADVFVMVTEIATSADSPKLETVYKMSQVEENGNVRYTAKFSPGKLSLPGIKQIYRKISNGIIEKDVVGLVGEENIGSPILVPIFRAGKLIYKMPSMEENKRYTEEQLSQLPEKYKDIFNEFDSPIEISQKVKDLLEIVRNKHVNNL